MTKSNSNKNLIMESNIMLNMKALKTKIPKNLLKKINTMEDKESSLTIS